MVKAQVWIKVREFSGVPTKDDFKLVEEELPALKDGGRTIPLFDVVILWCSFAIYYFKTNT